MVEISIVCLIYKSRPLAEALHNSLLKYTPKLRSGEAEFFFVANDPNEDVMKFLMSKNVPHYVNINKHLSDSELFRNGYATPEYMRRVYQGYNEGILRAKGQKIVLINSDNFFSPDWLENLLKYSDYNKVVSSTLVEPGQDRVGIFPYAIEKDFGKTLDDFNESSFQDFAEKSSVTGFTTGGAYMPCLLYKDIAVMAGLYPEGNLAGGSFDEVSRFGDEYFYDRLKEFGVEHITAKDSMVYHLKEGEKSEASKNSKQYQAPTNRHLKLNKRLVVHPTELMSYISPETRHNDVIRELARKVTVLILNPVSDVQVENNIKTVSSFEFQNIETVLISSNKTLVRRFAKRIKTIYSSPSSIDKALYDLFYAMYGEHLLVISDRCNYRKDLLSCVDERHASYYFGAKLVPGASITDYMGHFLFSKQTLVSNASSFLGFLLETDPIEVDFSNFEIVDISVTEEQNMPLLEETQPSNHIVKRIISKAKQDGLSGLAGAVRNRIVKR